MSDWEKWQTEFDRLANEIRRLSFATLSGSHTQWRPALNAYRLADRFVICLDLAGLNRRDISVRAEPRRLSISGTRRPLEPGRARDEPAHVLAMEIDEGPFQRVLELPETIDPDQVTAVYRDGLLWITLPIARNVKVVQPIGDETT